MKSELLGVLGAVMVLASCQGETLEFEARDGGSAGSVAAAGGAGGQAGSAGAAGAGVSDTCSSYSGFTESLQGKSCAEWPDIGSDACQACQCVDGSLSCTEYICNKDQCPSRVPERGSGCLGSDCECRYPTSCGMEHVARCEGGYWTVTYSTCAPDCPAEPPAAGTTCWTQQLRCDYDRAGCAPSHAYCGYPLLSVPYPGAAGVGLQWVTFTPACGDAGAVVPEDKCPAQQPAANDPCSIDSLRCNYDADCGVMQAYCNGTKWSLKQEGCNSSCPADRPRTGDACSEPSVSGPSPCTYAEGSSCLTECLCMTDGRWACFDTCGYGVAMQPGSIPEPAHRCSQGSWCEGIGSSCYYAAVSCTCTEQGWSCN